MCNRRQFASPDLLPAILTLCRVLPLNKDAKRLGRPTDWRGEQTGANPVFDLKADHRRIAFGISSIGRMSRSELGGGAVPGSMSMSRQ